MKLATQILRSGFAWALLLSVSAVAFAENNDRETQNKSIDKIRKGTLHLKGKAGTKVKVEQVKHEFWFGCAISSGVFAPNTKMPEADIKVYKEKFLENFNAAVTENAVKWASMERNRGEIDYETADNILDWTEDNNIPCRGHNLF